MKTTVERLRQIIQEEVDAYVLYQEKLKSKKDKADKKRLQAKGDKRSDEEDEDLEKLQHK